MCNELAGWNVKGLNKHRRQAVLSKCNGNANKAGQILLEHSKQSNNPQVRNKARADALFCFALARQNGGNQNA